MFQFGHSKEHRPDLPPLKINQSTLDPLGLPLSTTVVSGERADDPLYVPEIRKVQAILQQSGVLYVGDCKMAALATRAYLAASQDQYLCPLPAVQMPAATLHAVLAPVWTGEQALMPVYRAPVTASDKPQHIANGCSDQVTLTSAEGLAWQEQRLVVQSLKHAAAQHQRLQQAEQDIARLNQRGRGHKRLDEAQAHAAVDAILAQHQVSTLLVAADQVDTHPHAGRPRAPGPRGHHGQRHRAHAPRSGGRCADRAGLGLAGVREQ